MEDSKDKKREEIKRFLKELIEDLEAKKKMWGTL